MTLHLVNKENAEHFGINDKVGETGGNKMKYLLELQFFADDEELDETELDETELDENDENTEDDNEADENDENADEYDGFAPVITFDEILADKMYQSAFDKKVQKALATNAEKFEAEIKELQDFKTKYEEVDSEYKKFKQEATETEKQIKRDKAIEVALAKSGTKDEVALKAHLTDFMETAELDDKGNVTGIDERINTLKGSHGHLFGTAKKATGFELGKGDNKVTTDRQAVENAMGVKRN